MKLLVNHRNQSEQNKKDQAGIVHCGLQTVDTIQETSEVPAYARTMNCAFLFYKRPLVGGFTPSEKYESQLGL